MKPFLYTLLGAVILLGTVILFPSAIPDFKAKKIEAKPTEPKKVPSDSYLLSLKDIGFTNIPIVTEAIAAEKRKYIKEKYGLNYLSKNELDNIMKDNNLIIANADRYIGNMPLDIAKQIVENYNKFQNTDLNEDIWIAPDGRMFRTGQINRLPKKEDRDWIMMGNKTTSVIQVAAPVKEFNTERMVILNNHLVEPSKDPIALIEIEDGYIELARWLN